MDELNCHEEIDIICRNICQDVKMAQMVHGFLNGAQKQLNGISPAVYFVIKN
jgi:hypothetical protein